MLPLQLTDTALNATPIPPKPGTTPAWGDGGFAAMFQLVLLPEGDVSVVSTELDSSSDVPLPDTQIEVAIALPSAAASSPTENDAIPVEAASVVQPLPVTLVGDVDPDRAILGEANVPPQGLPSTDKVPVAVLRETSRASFAQTMVEGRFPQPQPVDNIRQTVPALPDAEAPQTSQITVQQATTRQDPKAVAEGVPQTLRTDSPSPATPATTSLAAKEPALVPSAATFPQAAAEVVARAITAPERPQRSDPLPSRGAQTDKVAADLKQVPPSMPLMAAIAADADTESTTKTSVRANTPPEVQKVGVTISGVGDIEKASKTALRADPLPEVQQGFGLTERSTAPAQHPTVTTAPVTSGAETARQVAGQISVAMTGQPGRATDIALNPEELGRVRLRMTAVDQSITLHILAERPETTDLLRRHIEVLAQEFRALGYNSISFSFGGGQGTGDADAETDGGFDSPLADQDLVEPDIKTMQVTGPQAGLDLRL